MTTMTLSVPNKEIGLFKLIAERMGWILQKEERVAPYGQPTQQAAERRGKQLDHYVNRFRTEDISEADILAEVDLVRQQMYESGEQTD